MKSGETGHSPHGDTPGAMIEDHGIVPHGPHAFHQATGLPIGTVVDAAVKRQHADFLTIGHWL